MTRERYIAHVTLTSGHLIPSPRSEVADDVVALCTELASRAARGEAKIPKLTPPCTLRVTRSGRCSLATIYGPGEAPLLTIGVAGHSRCGSALWRRLHEGRDDLATDPRRVPGEPWCAARIEQGVATLSPTALMELMPALADLGRCLAWALLELQ